MPRIYLEDCAVGDRTVTEPREITEADVVRFASISGDWMPIHTDAEHCRTTPIGERIAHGILVLETGCSSLSAADGSGLLPAKLIRLDAIDRVRFRNAVRFGDSIHTEAEIKSVEPLDGTRGLVTVKGTIKNQRDESAVAFTLRALAERRPGDAPSPPSGRTET